MMSLQPIDIDGRQALGIRVNLPKTTLLVIAAEHGYIMCGALDVQLLNDKLSERGIVAGRALGVRSLDDLLNAPLESVTYEAEKRGIVVGMKGRDAMRILVHE